MNKKKRSPYQTENIIKPVVQGMMIGLVSFVMFFCCICSAIAGLYLGVSSYQRSVRVTQYSEYYFDADVINDLCSKNLIPVSITDCSNSLTLQFYQMQDVVNSHIGEKYHTILKLFGEYHQHCQLGDRPPLPDTFRCWFRFDTEYGLVLVFSATTGDFLFIE